MLSTRFRRLHDRGFFIIPNAWDAASAIHFEKVGFRAIASTSAGAALARGKVDGDLGLKATLRNLRELVAATDLPVNADFENGFADSADGVARNVARAVTTGVAAVSIEDWSGRAMYDTVFAVERLIAAREAIDAIDPNVMLVGRNENFRVPGMTASESIERAVAYADAGADCLYVPFLSDIGAIQELVAAVSPKPVNVVIHADDGDVGPLVRVGVRRCSVGGSFAKWMWSAFDDRARTLKSLEPVAG